MSEQFYSSTLKKRRKGQWMKAEKRIAAQAAFLDAYEHTANVLRAAERAEIDRSLVYYWLEHDERFLFAYNLADAAANAHIEAEIRRRAMEGLEKPLVSAGRVVYVEVKDADGKRQKIPLMIREYSDTLLIFYAKRRMPEYREKQAFDVNQVGATQELRAVQDAIMAALSAYPDAKIAVAEALMRK